MSETTRCPSCRQQLELPEDLAGNSVRCPQCATTFTASPYAAMPAPTSRPAPADAYERRPRRRRFHDDYDDEEDDYAGGISRFDYQPHRGAAVLTLGILSLAVCGIIGPFAWIMGNIDLRESSPSVVSTRLGVSGQSPTKLPQRRA